MADTPSPSSDAVAAAVASNAREARLKEALKANLARRKAQARARAAREAEDTDPAGNEKD